MARKTFISYKYSEAKDLRDEIIEKLGEDAQYYKGETSESPDLTDRKTETIKEYLKQMIHGTSVTIVVISPNMKKSDWIDWEIKYSLKEITREDKTSRTNGIVGVIMKVNNSYDWFIEVVEKKDGCSILNYKSNKLPDIVKVNRANLIEPEYVCEECRTIDKLIGSYISLIKEEDFLKEPSKYIENAWEKSQKISKYDIKKQA